MDKAATSIIAILTGFIGVAIVAVIVSNQANTSGVINSATTGFANILKVVVSPVTGSTS